MAPKIFIDGEHGTTGLQIRERLAGRDDLDLLSLSMDERRDAKKRQSLLRDADIAILCLPDDAAKEAVALAEGAGTRFIDASTAHRTAPGWTYGFPEMTRDHAQVIAASDRVANVGCYATGSIALLRPLTDADLLPPDYPVTINAVSGYSGGGKQMIAQMEDPSAADAIAANHFAYALTLSHKHLPEIMGHGGITRRPVFTPAVGRFAQGMLVNLPLHLDLMAPGTTLDAIHDALTAHYEGCERVEIAPLAEPLPRLDAEEMTGTDGMRLHVFGGDGLANLVASLDNLGKGASGTAVQNLDLMIGR